MLDLTTRQLIDLWCQLEDCYHGRNGYGGDTAEIYSYSLQPYSPAAHLTSPGERNGIAGEAQLKAAQIAGHNLQAVCALFEEKRDCTVITGMGESIEMGEPFEHRVHITVIRK